MERFHFSRLMSLLGKCRKKEAAADQSRSHPHGQFFRMKISRFFTSCESTAMSITGTGRSQKHLHFLISNHFFIYKNNSYGNFNRKGYSRCKSCFA